MKKIAGVLLCLTLMLTAQAQSLKKADAARQRQMIERVNRTAAGITTLECRFTQVKTLRFLNDKMTSSGRMLFMADGGRLRWEYQQPYQYTFVINGEKVYISSDHNKQTIDIRQSRLFQSIAEMMMNSVTGKSLNSDKDFDCTMYEAVDEWQALLTPRRKEIKKMFKEIRLHFSAARQMVTQVEMTEQSGDKTVITLKDVKANGKIDAKMFAAQ